MDPFTQGTIGAVAAQSIDDKKVWSPFIIGWLSGMAPDLDILIRSDVDPLVYYEYHRHFTHSLFFLPFGALMLAALFYYLFRKQLAFKTVYLYSIFGMGTHGLLDSCTSYGTQLFWPFTNYRVALNNVAIIDPLYTLPLFVCCILAILKRKSKWARIGLLISTTYLLIGLAQRFRAESFLTGYLKGKKISFVELTAKPSIFNNFLWRGIVKTKTHFRAYAIRIPWWGESKIYQGDQAQIFDFQSFNQRYPPGSQHDIDIRKFSWFSQGYLAYHPKDPEVIGDFRYASLPNANNPLWGLRLGDDPNAHTKNATFRDMRNVQTLEQFKKMIYGE